MRLSDDNYAFLHGLETTVLGSWMPKGPECGHATCEELPNTWRHMKKKGMPWKQLQDMECDVCRSLPVVTSDIIQIWNH